MTADPKGIDPGDYKKWLREAISLATRHAWLWMLVMLAGALLWYVVKPYPFLPSFVFTATMVGLVIVAYLVDHSHLDIKRGRKPLVASRLVLLWLPLLLWAISIVIFNRSEIQWGTMTELMRHVIMYHGEFLTFLLSLAFIDAWFLIPLVLFGEHGFTSAMKITLPWIIQPVHFFLFVKITLIFLVADGVAMLTGGVVLPFVLAVFAAFLYCAYRDVFGHRDRNAEEATAAAISRRSGDYAV